MDFKKVDEYLGRMPFTDLYDALDSETKEAVVFAAGETLAEEYGRSRLSERAVALQSLYMIEGEREEFAKLKRQGVKTYNVKGLSVSFDGADIAPAVLRMMKGRTLTGGTGRLI